MLWDASIPLRKSRALSRFWRRPRTFPGNSSNSTAGSRPGRESASFLLPVTTMDAAENAVFGDKQIAVFVEGDAVRGDDDAGTPFVRLHVVAADARFGVCAELNDDLARFVEDRDAAFEFANDGIFAMGGDSRRQQQVLR